MLTRLRVRSKKSRTQIAVALGMEHDTYRRYEIGQTELRISQVRPFARAYGLSPSDLMRELGLLDPDMADRTEEWDIRRALRGHIPEAHIAGFAEAWASAEIEDQRAVVEAIIRSAQEAAREVSAEMLERQRRQNRPA